MFTPLFIRHFDGLTGVPMESLNLNTLANSLPNAQQNAEKEILNDFKGLFFLSKFSLIND